MPRLPTGLAVVVTIVILAVVNVVDVKVPHATLAVGPACAAVLLALARLAGLSWAELGLGPGTWRRGLAWAAETCQKTPELHRKIARIGAHGVSR